MACGSGCSTGCAKLAVTHDWFDNMLPPNVPEAENIYEIRFKSTRKGFYRNVHGLDLVTGDFVAVEGERGYDIGSVSMGGELVRLRMKKKKVEARFVANILRPATSNDLARLEELRQTEKEYLVRTRAIIYTLGLDMKLSDIEFQGDGSKAIFYYTAEHRVDFRELIRTLASEYKLRIEMRQIGLRQEAGLLGGLGSCGRELCCSTWLTDFKSVNTSAARYQNISLNPSKITGMCGRLKCCLNYELETYLDALRDIPDVKEIRTEIGTAYLQKTDIFKRLLWFSYGGDANWVPLDAEQVLEFREMNRKGIFPPNLTGTEESGGKPSGRPRPKMNLSQVRVAREGESEIARADYVDVVGQSDLHERNASKAHRRNKPKPQNLSGAKSSSGKGGGAAERTEKNIQNRPVQPGNNDGTGENSRKKKPFRRNRPENPQNREPKPEPPKNE